MATAATATLPRVKVKGLRRQPRAKAKAVSKTAAGPSFGQRFATVVR